MANLYTKYQKIFQNTNKWKYYKDLNVKEFPLNNKYLAWRFIKDYYEAGEKSKVFDKSIGNSDLRSLHSVSVFFLGIFLSEFVLDKKTKNEIEPSFKYLWFITSLYHDYSYLIEKNPAKFPIVKYKTFENIYSRLNVKYKLFDIVEPDLFSKKVIESYLLYCINELSFVNHGIIGGIILYDKLRQNYDHAWQEHNMRESLGTEECFEHNGLLWSISQFDFFSKIAFDIIYHNIWFCPKGKEFVYLGYGLEDLIIKDKIDANKKHKRSDNPFLFLLILADTIEPLKITEFEKHSAKELLEKINIDINSDKIIVEVLDDTLEYGRWFNSIKSLEDWMQVEVENKGKSLEINIL